jgi:hypothetical protein
MSKHPKVVTAVAQEPIPMTEFSEIRLITDDPT